MTDPVSFDSFLDGHVPASKRTACICCNLQHAETLDAAVRRLAERRALSSDAPDWTGLTRMEFFRAYVVPNFPGFKASEPRAFYRHVAECLGVNLG